MRVLRRPSTAAQSKVAASGKTAIQSFRSVTAGVRPATLAPGELFMNLADNVFVIPNAAGNGLVVIPQPMYYILAADYTNATTTYTNVFTFTAVQNAVYEIEVGLMWKGSATTTGLGLAINTSSGTQTFVMDIANKDSGTGGMTTIQLGQTATPVNGPVPSLTGTYAGANGRGIISQGTSPGLFQFLAAATGAGTLTLKKGSFMKVNRIQ
jgi:hypothetical protein